MNDANSGESAQMNHSSLLDRRILYLSILSIGLACVATATAQVLTSLIGLITNLAFYGKISPSLSSPAHHQLGYGMVFIPMIGGLIVGLMARFGSKAIRGHGIPEAMEQILFNDSKIPVRITFLKPISSAISIGTGGPFGAEGPIIATGGALGSVLGQLIETTSSERKTLLAAGAAAGMTAIFGSPISAVILAIELLVFEFRPRSFIPIALATATSATLRLYLTGNTPAFSLPPILEPTQQSIICYFLEGIAVGFVAVLITKFVYWIEDQFEHLPFHWMWWPVLGGLAIGVVGIFDPRTLGVGYDNIDHILSGELTGPTLLFFCTMKLLSWSISLGSGTSGGTLAPLFTIGGGLGAGIGALLAILFPHAGIDPKVAALVGMAATFTGASRALLASILFAFETTRQANGLLPLLSGCTASFMVSAFFMKHTIMTEKIARRGRKVPSEYVVDILRETHVTDYASRNVITLSADEPVLSLQAQVSAPNSPYRFQAYPVLNPMKDLIGLITRNEILAADATPSKTVQDLIQRKPIVIDKNATLRQALDTMIQEKVGRLIVSSHSKPNQCLGILTRKDILSAYLKSVHEFHHKEQSLKLFQIPMTKKAVEA